MKDANAKKVRPKRTDVKTKAEFDFSGGVRGKYAARITAEPPLARGPAPPVYPRARFTRSAVIGSSNTRAPAAS
jgi:hypothetical protein